MEANFALKEFPFFQKIEELRNDRDVSSLIYDLHQPQLEPENREAIESKIIALVKKSGIHKLFQYPTNQDKRKPFAGKRVLCMINDRPIYTSGWSPPPALTERKSFAGIIAIDILPNLRKVDEAVTSISQRVFMGSQFTIGTYTLQSGLPKKLFTVTLRRPVESTHFSEVTWGRKVILFE